jgi:peptidoglycan/LPS O-acetylase OafA/YrhL
MGAFSRLPRRWWAGVVVGLAQLGVVFFASRVAGTRESADEALWLLVPAAVAVVVLLAAVSPGPRHRARDSSVLSASGRGR